MEEESSHRGGAGAEKVGALPLGGQSPESPMTVAVDPVHGWLQEARGLGDLTFSTNARKEREGGNYSYRGDESVRIELEPEKRSIYLQSWGFQPSQRF